MRILKASILILAFMLSSSVGVAQTPLPGLAQGWAGLSMESASGVGDIPAHLEPNLALDSENRPRIAYYASPDYLYGSLHYMSWDGATWSETVVDPVGGGYPSMQLDQDDWAHIAYYMFGPDGQVRYASETATGWVTQTIRSNLPVMGTGFDLALGLSQSGVPHVMYPVYVGSGYTFRLLQQTPGDWQDDPILGYVGRSPAIRIDALDRVHVSFYDPQLHHIVYGNDDGSGTWSSQVIQSVGDQGLQVVAVALDLDSTGAPHVVFADGDTARLIYASPLTGTTWVTETIAPAFSTVASLTIDRNDVPHVAYIDSANGALVYTIREPGGWQPQTIATDPASYVSLDVSSQNVPYVAYTDLGTGGLGLAFLLPYKTFIPIVRR